MYVCLIVAFFAKYHDTVHLTYLIKPVPQLGLCQILRKHVQIQAVLAHS
jgi:hypothetical protein